jgi:FkbM family methyltransferase
LTNKVWIVMAIWFRRLWKVARSLSNRGTALALIRHRVLAGIEHEPVIPSCLVTAVDIGANRGQFSLALQAFAPDCRVFAFEPLQGPASIFKRVFAGRPKVALFNAAIGPLAEQRMIHISRRDDSSSLLAISQRQVETFPGTEEIGKCEVGVAPLDAFVATQDLQRPCFLKIDVQGFELEVLKGCEALLGSFDYVYCECSFVELYADQALAPEIIDWLKARGFGLRGVYNCTYRGSSCVQADFLFHRLISGRS